MKNYFLFYFLNQHLLPAALEGVKSRKYAVGDKNWKQCVGDGTCIYIFVFY